MDSCHFPGGYSYLPWWFNGDESHLRKQQLRCNTNPMWWCTITPRKLNSSPLKAVMVGRQAFPVGKVKFSGAMWNFQGVIQLWLCKSNVILTIQQGTSHFSKTLMMPTTTCQFLFLMKETWSSIFCPNMLILVSFFQSQNYRNNFSNTKIRNPHQLHVSSSTHSVIFVGSWRH